MGCGSSFQSARASTQKMVPRSRVAATFVFAGWESGPTPRPVEVALTEHLAPMRFLVKPPKMAFQDMGHRGSFQDFPDTVRRDKPADRGYHPSAQLKRSLSTTTPRNAVCLWNLIWCGGRGLRSWRRAVHQVLQFPYGIHCPQSSSDDGNVAGHNFQKR